ncbi:dienelactone hydrolase family protein [Paludisphaera mucosa]|uniref:Prolyl oligopeptidase family serine peptidase n=1 Tax=Paludisphaera mucosa TaxID=3030827 RepID=A0ABT6FJN6_9BACT|nr:prolyl oligopeptidase family serine peptidase [Paludisphaera mucosa]MDG3007791.1 prolyl oligopeptidase family serine peptidase [Paludisphaera mucosa]
MAVFAVALLAAPPLRAGDDGPPAAFAGDLGTYRSPLMFEDGRVARTKAEWGERRREILRGWRARIGEEPPRIERPRLELLGEERRGAFLQRRVRVQVAADRTAPGYVLIPDGPGPHPAVLTVFYEPETAVGLGEKPHRDFARRLAERGFVALSIGFDPRVLDPSKWEPPIQPLAYLAHVASNALTALQGLPEVDPARVGVVGHSYGGKWALFAACLDERFACGVWSDPGIVFDESRSNVNYWEPWYLGWEPGRRREPGLVTPADPRTGAYARLVADGRDLHELLALMPPRPFLVSGGAEDPPERWRALNHVLAVDALLGVRPGVAMTNRPAHEPTDESNGRIDAFLENVLGPARRR